VDVRALTKMFPIRRGLVEIIRKAPPRYVHAVDDISFDIIAGEVFGVVGESGSGKTTTGRLVLRLIEPTSGRILFDGTDITRVSMDRLRSLRKKMQMIFQDPYASLNPRYTLARTLEEPLLIHKSSEDARERLELICRALDEVRLTPASEFLEKYPHELSGGQRQRVAIARALVLKPKLIVADEPVSMLDVSVRAEILELMEKVKEKHDLTIFFITHDLSLARYFCDRIAVMYLGKIVETAPSDIVEKPVHPYTKALVAAVPEPDPSNRDKRREIKVKGEIPSATAPPAGCRFHPRCMYMTDSCKEVEPQPVEVERGHFVACHNYQTVN